MTTLTPPRAIGRKDDLATLRSLWKDIKRDLLRGKHLIDEEIRSYPTPIPRCDAQFNHLYEQQARLARELDRIGALSEKSLGRGDCIRLIEEFTASAPYTDDAVERDFRARCRAELSRAAR